MLRRGSRARFGLGLRFSALVGFNALALVFLKPLGFFQPPAISLFLGFHLGAALGFNFLALGERCLPGLQLGFRQALLLGGLLGCGQRCGFSRFFRRSRGLRFRSPRRHDNALLLGLDKHLLGAPV